MSFPYPHKPFYWRGKPCHSPQRVMKGWWPSIIPNYDMAGRYCPKPIVRA